MGKMLEIHYNAFQTIKEQLKVQGILSEKKKKLNCFNRLQKKLSKRY